MSLDKLVESDILATCNNLGTEIQGVYVKGEHCIECLKDILRYLKKDGDDHAILCFLGSIRVLQNDLLPLFKHHHKDNEVFDFTLRILVALTNPALLLYKEDIPDDKLTRNTYLQIISYLQSYKKAFIDIGVWNTLYEHLSDIIEMKPIERSHNENLFLERMMILIRNVLHVPPDDTICKQTSDDDSVHDKIINCLKVSKVGIIILYQCASTEEHKFIMHALEIMYLLLREHTPETLAKANEERSTTEKEEDLKILLAARQREQKLKSQKIQSLTASRFNGVYCVKNMKSLSENDYILHKFISNPKDVKFDLQKDYKRKPKNRACAPDVDNTRQSTLQIRLFLKVICNQFLGYYNKIMVSVKRELLRSTGDDHDDSYYLWAIYYFMQFNRLHDFQVAFVSETISVQTFHHIQTHITNYQEMMLTDKKKAKIWAKRMQFGVSAYKELLETLKIMEKSEDKGTKKGADALIKHVFYVIEYREMLFSLLSNYDEVKFSLSYLAELVESTQLFLKMLENHSKKHSEIIVQKKLKKTRKRKKKKSLVADEPINTEVQLNDQWNSLIGELSKAITQKHPIPDVTPFDGASNLSFEEQKVEAVYKIREALIANKPLEAIGLLRAARELWPEGNSFGASDIDLDSEINVLKEIHLSGLQRNPCENKVDFVESDDEEEDEEIEAQSSIAEQKLDVDDVYKKYANHKVVYPCSLLLANYQNNKPQTNLCLIKLLHRIAWNCKMHALFFQSTIFLTFQKIFHDPDVSCNPIIKEFYRFAKFIVRKFFLTVEKNKKIFVELLFWKGSREAHEVEEGYETSESKGKAWTEEEDEELTYLFEENKNIYIEGQDVADIILANLNTRKRNKPQIISALKRLGLIESAKDLKPEKRKVWLEAEIIELKHLFEDNKHSADVMSIILDKLSIKRSRKAVIEKLLELNLIADKKEIRKKRTKKSKDANSDENDNSSGDSEGEDNAFDPNRSQNSDSSNDEDEINFFKSLEAERYISDDDTQHSQNEDSSHSKQKLSDSADLRENIKNKKSQSVWEEQEILELTNLYNENSQSDDIMHKISSSLSVKRSKEDIIQKLLEIGLIKNKKEIKKKRKHEKKKLHNSKNNIENNLNENSENDLDAPIKSKLVDKTKGWKNLKRRILSDSDDEDQNNSLLKDSKSPTVSQSKKKQSKIWNEEEIIRLNHLFVEHKDDDDTLSKIVCNLITKRTKKDVIEKMLEIGLIKNKSDLKKKKMLNITDFSNGNSNKISRKPKSKKSSEMWEESELVELNQLYQNYKGNSDIITDILNGLTLKRNKKDVVEKMLEIGLILDKKEIRKKRISKKIKAKQNSHNTPESESESEAHQNLKSKNSNKVSSESSDEDNMPLISVSNMSLKNDAVSDSKISSEVNLADKEPVLSDKIVTNDNDFSKTEIELHPISSKESPHENERSKHKRKRLLISSDSDSGDDGNTSVNKDLLNSDSLDQSISMLDSSENFQDNSLLKKQKKKIRILEDSDESD